MVYRYGALKPRVLDNDGAELPFETLLDYQRLSNRFYNALVEIERWRIAARDITEDLQQAPLDEAQKTEHRLAYNAACRAAGAATSLGGRIRTPRRVAVERAVGSADQSAQIADGPT